MHNIRCAGCCFRWALLLLLLLPPLLQTIRDELRGSNSCEKKRKEIIIKKQTTHLDQYEEQCNRYATQSSTLHNNRVRTMDLIPPVFKANYIAEANVFVFIFFYFKCVSGVHFANV